MDKHATESADRVLQPLDLVWLFEGPREFLEHGVSCFYYSVGYVSRCGVYASTEWLDRSPLDSKTAFLAARAVLDTAHNAEVMIGTPGLGPYLGDRRLDYRTPYGAVRPAWAAASHHAWTALTQHLLERSAELYERGQWLLMVEEERGSDEPRRDVEVGHDGRSRATRRHRPGTR